VPDPADVDPVGGWAADVAVRLPPKAENATAETSIPSETEIARLDGVLTVTGRLATDPGASMSLIVNYRVAEAKIGDGAYRMLVLPQPSWPPDRVRIRIEAPPGTLITEGSDELEIGGSIAQFTGRPTRPMSLWIRFD
jgi:hypothetical protein